MLVVLILGASCSRTSHRAFEKNAILRFDNLSGDPQYDWLCSAAAEVLAKQLTGAPGSLALTVATVNDAFVSGATRLIHGSFDSPTSFHVAIEDADTRKMTATGAFTGPAIESLDKIAHLANRQAQPFSTTKESSLEAWGAGKFEQAAAEDPGFSAAWLGWLRALALKRNSAEGSRVAERALAAPLRSPIDKAEIEALAATIQDNRPERVKAMEVLARSIAFDSQLWRALAEEQMKARLFSKAVESFERTSQLEPANPNTLNALGYAQAFAGDTEAAKKTFARYGGFPNEAANALDSTGDAYFMNGNFAEAEQSFLAAQTKNPAFLNGSELAKVAYTRFLAGNQAGADQAMKEFLIARVKQHDPLTTWREATWLYTTGHQAQASAELEKAAVDEETPKQVVDLIKKQLMVWQDPGAVPKDLNVLKQAYEHTAPAQDGLVRTFYAAALVEAGRKDEARDLVKIWPLPESAGEPQFQSLLYPKFLEVKKAVQ